MFQSSSLSSGLVTAPLPNLFLRKNHTHSLSSYSEAHGTAILIKYYNTPCVQKSEEAESCKFFIVQNVLTHKHTPAPTHKILGGEGGGRGQVWKAPGGFPLS